MIRILAALGCAALACLPIKAAEAPDVPANDTKPPPLERFFVPTSYRQPRIAPDGASYLVVVAVGKNEVITRVDLSTGKVTPLAKTNGHIRDYWFKEPNYLILHTETNDSYSIQSFNLTTQSEGEKVTADRLISLLPNEPDNVLIESRSPTGLDLLKLNLQSGKTSHASTESNFVTRWLVDVNGKIVAGFGRFQDKWFIKFPQPDGKWRRVELGIRTRPDFQPVFVAEDQRRVVGFDYSSGNLIGVMIWDPANDVKERVTFNESIDPDVLTTRSNDWTRLHSIIYETDRPRLRYLNPEDQAIYDMVGRALPDSCNFVVSISRDRARSIVLSYSDRGNIDYLLFNSGTRKLSRLGSAYAKDPPEYVAPNRRFEFTSRDGQKLFGRVTAPKGNTPLPAVVMTQWDERSRYGYWPLSQALASRGIATIEIDTRGTEGYGNNFWSAGNLEAGGKRIEDLIDGIDHLAHEGIVDPKRIAVEGHGLNAVLAFQAAAKYPDRFTALVNFWAPTDLDNYHYMTFIGGRLTKDEVREKFGGETAIRRYLDSLAPLETLNRIHQPTFHHYIRLPTGKLPDDAKKFQRAVAKLGSPHVFHEGTLPVNSFAGYMSTLDQESAAEWTRTTGMLLQFLEHTIVRK